MMILMKQTNILHLYLLSRVQMGPQQRLKQNFIKKKNLFPWKRSNFDEIFPARKQNPNLLFKGLTRCLLFKREKGSGEEAGVCGFGRKEILPINGNNESRGKKVQIPRHSRHIWYPLHPALCISVVHISVFHCRGSCISVGSYCMKSFV